MRRPPTTTGIRSIAPAIAVSIAVAGALPACAPPDERPHGAVLIVLDTVRPDRLSAYGHDRPTSPRIDALAARGVLFEQAVSSAPWTLPAMVSILAGEQPGAAFAGNRLRSSIVESIRDAGFATAAFTEGGYVSREFGLERGFVVWREEQGAVQLLRPGQPRAAAGGGIERTFAEATAWIEAHRDEPFFVLIHTYEPHTPYTRRTFAAELDPGRVGETFGIERLPELRSGALVLDAAELGYVGALYDGGILESDRHVGALVDRLDAIGLADRTLIVVTSDHGEELGDHYPRHAADHGHSLLDDQVLVPLIVADPTLRPDVTRVRAQVRTLDILPTIAERLGVGAPAVAGRSLLPLVRGEEGGGRAAFGGSTKAGPRRFFLRHLGYKYVEVAPRPPARGAPLVPEPPHVQLFDLVADPGETTDIAGERPDLVARFRDELAAKQRGVDPTIEEPTTEDDALLERLRSLGYVR